jgi:Bpu10I restriction endonuclease
VNKGETTSLSTYPTPHFEKLKATLASDKLPADDRPQIEKAIENYERWIANMDVIMNSDEPPQQKLRNMVDTLNQYRIRMDIDLIFDSANDWLYRQKGQIKLDNSIIEEFLPRLVHPSLIPEISQMHVYVGPVEAFSSLWFDSSLVRPEKAGGLNMRTKNQDFAISRPLYLRASHSPDFQDAIEQSTHLTYIAAECKTNLDKTMFQEASATARDLKTAIPGAKYLLLCEWLDMKPISSGTTHIDQVLLLRKAKRISSNIRGTFSTYKGRQAAKAAYIEFLNSHPYRLEVFEIFMSSIRQLLTNDPLDEETVLERGYF